jgi:pimeloyl-ACP methyl ester carboxylesterase
VSIQLHEDGLAYEDYPAVTQPCLVFHGTRDEAVPDACSREFSSSRPNVRLVLFDSGHELTDRLEEMWEQVRPFVLGAA